MSPRSSRDKKKDDGRDGPTDRSSYLIASLARGLAVLDAFTPGRPELSLKDIAEAAAVTPASALKIGHTLVTAGYLVRNPMTKGFRPGPHMIGAALATLASLTVPDLAEPFLLDLRDRTQETVSLAIPAEREVMIVLRIPSPSSPPLSRYPGAGLPYQTSSLGLAILAWLPTEEVETILAQGEPANMTPRSPTSAQALEQLPKIRRRGYSVNDQGTTVEHRSAAAPLFGPDGLPIAAINVSVTAKSVSRRELEGRLAPMVVETAAAITRTIPPDVQRPGWASFG